MERQAVANIPSEAAAAANTELTLGLAGSISISDSGSSSDDEDLQVLDRSKKRKRPLKISCELCKARKVKCDRAEPSCGWCARNHRICIYKERKKPNLRASYGVELEDKLNRIETSLYALSQRLDEHILVHPGSGHGINQPSDHDNVLRTGLSRAQWSAESSPRNEKTDASQHGSSGLNGSHDDHGMPHQPSHGVTIGSDQAHVALHEDGLPPFELLVNIVDLYFKHVGTWSPILERKATFDTLYDRPRSSQQDDRILLHGIVVVALRFCKHPDLTQTLKRSYHNTSKHKVQLYALENSTVAALKALALVTVDALGTSSAPLGWNLLALLTQNITQRGLNVEKSVYLAPLTDGQALDRRSPFALPQPDSWIEDEGRRRLYWLTYVLDRYTTVATNFNFILDESSSDRSLPCRYDLFSKDEAVETRWMRVGSSADLSKDSPEHLGSFSYHCEVLQILSRIHEFLRQPVDVESTVEVNRWRDHYHNLDGRLNSWLSHLPGEYGKISQLCHSDPGSRVSNWIMIHAAFVTSVIRLHSMAAYPAVQSHLFTSSPNAVQRCLAAVDSIRAIAQDVIDTEMLDLLGPPFAFSLWTSGRLLLVHAAVTGSKLDEKLWFLVNTLERMGQFWELAKLWATTLAHLAVEGRQADDEIEQGRTTSKKTYAEMRRCAHDLAMLVARRPRTVIDPPATRTTSSIELEYLEVFEWFDYPLHSSSGSMHGGSAVSFAANSQPTNILSLARVDNEWLHDRRSYEFKPPYE